MRKKCKVVQGVEQGLTQFSINVYFCFYYRVVYMHAFSTSSLNVYCIPGARLGAEDSGE